MTHSLEYYSQGLLDALFSNVGMQAIVELAAKYLGNPVAVGTVRLTVLYTSHNMPAQVPMAQPGIIPPDFTNEQSVIHFNEVAFYSEEPILTDKQWGGYRTLLARLSQNGEVVGYMSIFFCEQDYDPQIKPLVKLIRTVIESELLKDNALIFRSTSPAQRLLNSILSDDSKQLMSNADAVIQLGLNKQSHFYILTFKMSYYSRANKPNSIYRDNLSELTGATLSTFYQETIVLIVQGSIRNLVTNTPNRRALLEYLDTYGLCGGISYMCRQISDIPCAFMQASAAMNSVGSDGTQCTGLLTYDSIVVPKLIQQIVDKNHLSYLTPELLVLMDYDKSHGTNYCQVIELYVESGKNVYLTASLAGLSKSSIYRILDRIKALTDIDLNQNDQLFALYFGIKINNRV